MIAEETLPVGRRGYAIYSFEEAAEVILVDKFKAKSDFLDWFVGLNEKLDGFLIQPTAEPRLGTHPHAPAESH